jgi:hypothetical protein
MGGALLGGEFGKSSWREDREAPEVRMERETPCYEIEV